jgi:hypothetical protein
MPFQLFFQTQSVATTQGVAPERLWVTKEQARLLLEKFSAQFYLKQLLKALRLGGEKRLCAPSKKPSVQTKLWQLLKALRPCSLASLREKSNRVKPSNRVKTYFSSNLKN